MESARNLAQAISDTIINPIIGLLFICALFFFMYGAYRYLGAEAGSANRLQGKNHMLWGIIGMVAMLSVYSILAILLRTFGVTDLGPVTPYLSNLPL